MPTTCAAEGATCGTISDGCGGTLVCGGSCVVANVPGRIEAEDYDAFYDTDSTNQGASGSPSCSNGDAVDIGTNSEGTCTIGWTANGEWLEYDLEVESTANFDIIARAGSGTTGGAFSVKIDGVTVASSVSVGNIGWASYANYTVKTNHAISAGSHTLRVTFLGSMNLNWIEFAEAGSSPPPPSGLGCSTGNSTALSTGAQHNLNAGQCYSFNKQGTNLQMGNWAGGTYTANIQDSTGASFSQSLNATGWKTVTGVANGTGFFKPTASGNVQLGYW
jgi:hypothetical protein